MTRRKITDKRICLNCNSDKTYITKERWSRAQWHRYKDGWICSKCYHKLLVDPTRNPRHLRFKDKHIFLKENPRKHICSQCGKLGYTHMHHVQYHDDDPLKDTVELCASCHAFETWKSRKQ